CLTITGAIVTSYEEKDADEINFGSKLNQSFRMAPKTDDQTLDVIFAVATLGMCAAIPLATKLARMSKAEALKKMGKSADEAIDAIGSSKQAEQAADSSASAEAAASRMTAEGKPKEFQLRDNIAVSDETMAAKAEFIEPA